MTADIDTQDLFFKAKQHFLAVFTYIRHPDIKFFLIFFAGDIKQGNLSCQVVFLVMGDVIRDLHIDAHELFSGAAQSVHGSCFDQVLNGPLIHLFLSDMRVMKSFRFVKGPLSLRSCTRLSMTGRPTPLMAVRA